MEICRIILFIKELHIPKLLNHKKVYNLLNKKLPNKDICV